jgi:NADP-dependent 3-hydroxy acid dehydrogenase YdfG
MTKHLYILTGASRGMGLAMAQQLLQAGHSLLCISRQTHEPLNTLASTHAASVTQWSQDLADGVGASARLSTWLHSQAPQQWASVTLINNAGVIPRIGPMSQADAADLGHALRVGLEAPMQLTAAFLSATENWNLPRKVLKNIHEECRIVTS